MALGSAGVAVLLLIFGYHFFSRESLSQLPAEDNPTLAEAHDSSNQKTPHTELKSPAKAANTAAPSEKVEQLNETLFWISIRKAESDEMLRLGTAVYMGQMHFATTAEIITVYERVLASGHKGTLVSAATDQVLSIDQAIVHPEYQTTSKRLSELESTLEGIENATVSYSESQLRDLKESIEEELKKIARFDAAIIVVKEWQGPALKLGTNSKTEAPSLTLLNSGFPLNQPQLRSSSVKKIEKLALDAKHLSLCKDNDESHWEILPGTLSPSHNYYGCPLIAGDHLVGLVKSIDDEGRGETVSTEPFQEILSLRTVK